LRFFRCWGAARGIEASYCRGAFFFPFSGKLDASFSRIPSLHLPPPFGAGFYFSRLSTRTSDRDISSPPRPFSCASFLLVAEVRLWRPRGRAPGALSRLPADDRGRRALPLLSMKSRLRFLPSCFFFFWSSRFCQPASRTFLFFSHGFLPFSCPYLLFFYAFFFPAWALAFPRGVGRRPSKNRLPIICRTTGFYFQSASPPLLGMKGEGCFFFYPYFFFLRSCPQAADPCFPSDHTFFLSLPTSRVASCGRFFVSLCRFSLLWPISPGI